MSCEDVGITCVNNAKPQRCIECVGTGEREEREEKQTQQYSNGMKAKRCDQESITEVEPKSE